MKFGENLKLLRRQRNLSQEDLAEKVNVSRQSVSKWETGDAYPEMNNILELCKIFHCHINDLVHENMSDIDSLDEEIKMSVVKLNKEKQKQMKGLSHVISLIGKIGGIVLKVLIPFVAIAMVIVPIAINNVEIEDNKIAFKNEKIKLEDDKLSINNIVIGEIDAKDTRIIDTLNNHSKTELIIYVETALTFLIVEMVLTIIILSYIEKLFSNIETESSPFTLDNINYIRKISYLMIALIVVNSISSGTAEFITKIESADSGFGLITIIEILIILSMSHIFEYGYEIQKDSKGVMYDEEEK